MPTDFSFQYCRMPFSKPAGHTALRQVIRRYNLSAGYFLNSFSKIVEIWGIVILHSSRLSRNRYKRFFPFLKERNSSVSNSSLISQESELHIARLMDRMQSPCAIASARTLSVSFSNTSLLPIPGSPSKIRTGRCWTDSKVMASIP